MTTPREDGQLYLVRVQRNSTYETTYQPEYRLAWARDRCDAEKKVLADLGDDPWTCRADAYGVLGAP